MKQLFRHSALLVAASSLLTVLSASAANSFYAPGDLVLFFQKEGGSNTVYANLGSAATLYRGTAAGAADGTNNLNFLDLNTTLTSAFGAGWASDPAIYAGLGGVFSTNVTTNLVTLGDAARTLYISQRRDSVGTVGEVNSSQWLVAGNTQMSAGSNGILQMNQAFEVNYDSTVTVSPTSISTIDNTNPFLAPGIQGAAFASAFDGGVQQRGTAGSFGSFGEAGSVEFALDLYRILGKTGLPDQVDGVLREGSYEGTVTVGTNGLVSFVAVPEPSSMALAGLATGALALRRRRRN